ncbi:MAG: hypothetical protein N2Z63_07250 [Thiobacillaceae bacterium]|nr:hypothetical protein [Thiobacillaceae bacterium]
MSDRQHKSAWIAALHAQVSNLKRMRKHLGTSKNRRERLEGKAHGAQDARHIKQIGEHPSTAQRRHPATQQVFRGALLDYSRGKIRAWWHQDSEVDQLDEDRLESLAAFKARCAELQDHLGGAMRLVARIEDEDITRFTDVLDDMTRLGVSDDMENGQAVRELRNAAAHDYAAANAEKVRHFEQLLHYTPYQCETLERLRHFVETAYPRVTANK